MITAAQSLPPLIASRYLPVRLIAKGGMGAVYEVEHVRTGEHLALKVLLSSVGSSAQELERFKREARASARIKSEHVVRVTDADVAPELEGAPFLVMELLEGADLEREAQSSPPPPAMVVAWLRQVARALDKAHRLGIIHRDLKPEILFLARVEDRAPIVKILDFGIVKMIEDGGGATGSGQILGTPRYMAPEQASTQARVTAAADRYSLGLIAYRFLTGEPYYQGDMLSILSQLLHDSLKAPSLRHPRLGAAFDAWFLRACHRDPQARFTSAAEQIEELSVALGLPTIGLAAAGQPTGANGAPSWYRKVFVAVLVGVTLAGAVLAGVTLVRRSRGQPPAARTGWSQSPSSLPLSPPPNSAASTPLATPSSPDSLLAVPVPSARPLRKQRAFARRFSDAAPAALPVPAAPAATSLAPKEGPKQADPYADQK